MTLFDIIIPCGTTGAQAVALRLGGLGPWLAGPFWGAQHLGLWGIAHYGTV